MITLKNKNKKIVIIKAIIKPTLNIFTLDLQEKNEKPKFVLGLN